MESANFGGPYTFGSPEISWKWFDRGRRHKWEQNTPISYHCLHLPHLASMQVGTPVRPFHFGQKDLLFETQVDPVTSQEGLPPQRTCMVNVKWRVHIIILSNQIYCHSIPVISYHITVKSCENTSYHTVSFQIPTSFWWERETGELKETEKIEEKQNLEKIWQEVRSCWKSWEMVLNVLQEVSSLGKSMEVFRSSSRQTWFLDPHRVTLLKPPPMGSMMSHATFL